MAALAFCFIAAVPAPSAAQTLRSQERLCDPTFEDCRADILTYIRQETVGIDMAFWMMADARYSNELVNAFNRGVRIRVLMDPRCADSHPACVPPLDQLRAAGVPMRKRVAGGILHWKMVLFAGQGQVEFSGANYTPFEMTPDQPYVNFTDEVVYYSNDTAVVRSFMRKFDDLWTSTSEFANYANVSGALTRRYSQYSIDPELNFPPDESFRTRAVNAYAGEPQRIDVMMFRITDESHTDAMIQAAARGVGVRLITDEIEYRNPSRFWHAYNVDKMYAAGVPVRLDAHHGLNHAKAVMLYGSGLSIFGSSNWTSPSADSQREHNYFTRKPWILSWLATLFDRKWNNRTGFSETKPFVPLPPDVPSYALPGNGAGGVPTSGITLTWDAGLWAHYYDIYLGITPSPPLFAANQRLGPSQWTGDYRRFVLPTLLPGTRYYWKVVPKTMAFVAADAPVWSFVTAGTPPPRLSPADADGDGSGDLIVFRRSTGMWFTLLSGQGFRGSHSVAWGSGADVPIGGDFDGDGRTDRTVYRPATGTWNILRSSSGFGTATTLQWGAAEDVALQGDLDGDGRADPVVWRPSSGTWFWLTSSSGYSAASSRSKQWGLGSLGDVPLLAEIDGDGRADLIVWRASTGTWYWLTSSSGYSYTASGARQWGSAAFGDVPLAGDVDGDGRGDLLVWRPGSGMWFWLKSSAAYQTAQYGSAVWGTRGDLPLLIDMDGDRVMDLTIWRPSNGTWYWLLSSTRFAWGDGRQWGNALLGDVPVVK